MNNFIYRGTKKLRCGYTTGSCVAGGAKAAAEMLAGGKTVSRIELMTPAGIPLVLDVLDAELTNDYASCCIRKDSGDDPDITNGICIYAKVRKIHEGIVITGGEGIGKVTKPGLDQPPGEYAINSTPRRMIKEALEEISEKFGYSGGFHVTVYAPEGTETAKKTYNPRMGITGGISVIGTTGIVEPMSSTAVIDTIRAEANIHRMSGEDDLLLTVGNYSDTFMQNHLPELAGKAVMCSNFIGDALDIGVALGFKNILLVGHIGKLVKLGSGIMNTHSSYADGRMETFIACGALAGVSRDLLVLLPECITADAALDILEKDPAYMDCLNILTERIENYMSLRVKDQVRTAAVIFSDKHDLILKTSIADEIINKMQT